MFRPCTVKDLRHNLKECWDRLVLSAMGTGYGVWRRPHKQVIRNAEIPKGLVYYAVTGAPAVQMDREDICPHV